VGLRKEGPARIAYCVFRVAYTTSGSSFSANLSGKHVCKTLLFAIASDGLGLTMRDMKPASCVATAILLASMAGVCVLGQTPEVDNIRAHAEKGETEAQNTLGLAY